MTQSIVRRTLQVSAVLAVTGAIAVAGTGVAVAGTLVSTSSARSVTLTLARNPALLSPAVHAVNFGGADDTVTGTTLSLPGQSLLDVGALSVTATATSQGVSYACAGVPRPGGTLSVGTDGNSCTGNGTGARGITIDLGSLTNLVVPGIGSIVLKANAITALATDRSGVLSGVAKVVNPLIERG